jgi:hypothetical protein
MSGTRTRCEAARDRSRGAGLRSCAESSSETMRDNAADGGPNGEPHRSRRGTASPGSLCPLLHAIRANVRCSPIPQSSGGVARRTPLQPRPATYTELRSGGPTERRRYVDSGPPPAAASDGRYVPRQVLREGRRKRAARSSSITASGSPGARKHLNRMRPDDRACKGFAEHARGGRRSPRRQRRELSSPLTRSLGRDRSTPRVREAAEALRR